MGGPGVGPVEKGTRGIVWAATLPNDGALKRLLKTLDCTESRSETFLKYIS